MYMLVAIAVTVLVIALAWRGIGARSLGQGGEEGGRGPERRPGRGATRTLAPDDDPDFLSEIERKLRGEDKSS